MNLLFTGSPVDLQGQDKIRTLLAGIDDARLERKFKWIEVCVHPALENDKSVEHVHTVWNVSYFAEVESPDGLPRLPQGAPCPRGSSLVEVSFISRRSGGMGSYHQFDGFFLSLVLSAEFMGILDARIEKAY